MNNTVLIGRLTRAVDLKFTGNGAAVGNFTLAVDRGFKNANGEKETDFINCVIWKKSAEALANYTKKGSMISVRGRIQTRTYDNSDGKKVYVTEIVVEEFTFLDSKKSSDNQNNESESNYKNFGNENPFDREDVSKPIDISDDDLPF